MHLLFLDEVFSTFKNPNLPILPRCFLCVWSNRDQPSQLQSENHNFPVLGMCDKSLWVLGSASFIFHPQPRQGRLLQRFWRYLAAPSVLLISPRKPSPASSVCLGGSLFFFPFFPFSFFLFPPFFYFYFSFPSHFFSGLSWPYMALHKALSGSKFSALSWDSWKSLLFEISATVQVPALYSFAFWFDMWSSCEFLSLGSWHCLEITHGASILFF